MLAEAIEMTFQCQPSTYPLIHRPPFASRGAAEIAEIIPHHSSFNPRRTQLPCLPHKPPPLRASASPRDPFPATIFFCLTRSRGDRRGSQPQKTHRTQKREPMGCWLGSLPAFPAFCVFLRSLRQSRFRSSASPRDSFPSRNHCPDAHHTQGQMSHASGTCRDLRRVAAGHPP